MSTNRFEARKAETKTVIQQTFIALLHEKAFDEITVREISEQANIGFKTFYRHYKDKTELTNAIIEDFLLVLSPHLSPPVTLDATLANLRTVLGFIQDNAQALHAIGQTPSRDTLMEPLIQFAFQDGLPRPVAKTADQADPNIAKKQELVAHHFVHGQLALFYWWVADGLTLSLDEMAEMIGNLVIRPIWALAESPSSD